MQPGPQPGPQPGSQSGLQRVHTIEALRTQLASARAVGSRVGLVPTMGALHEGHAALVAAAAADNDVVVTSIFVNPLQFAPTDDLAAYPRDLDGDHRLAEAAGATLLFVPSVDEMYPQGSAGVLTSVHVGGITDVLDGRARPGHFDGVATVVTKLFNIVGPCRAYFGEKDFQQLAVITRMTNDLSVPVEIVACPTVRLPSGLAQSSRNRYLSDDQQVRAAVIYRTLQAGRMSIERDGVSDPSVVRNLMQQLLQSSPVIDAIDYAEVVDSSTLSRPEVLVGPVRLLVAVKVGPARLIDNVGAIAPSVATASR